MKWFLIFNTLIAFVFIRCYFTMAQGESDSPIQNCCKIFEEMAEPATRISELLKYVGEKWVELLEKRKQKGTDVTSQASNVLTSQSGVPPENDVTSPPDVTPGLTTTNSSISHDLDDGSMTTESTFSCSTAQSTKETSSTVQTTVPVVCASEELSYGGKCYFKIDDIANYDQLRSSCISNGGTPADIVDETHYREVLDYIQPGIPSSQSFEWIMLGTTKSSHTQSPTPYIRWRRSGNQFTDDKPHLVLRVYRENTFANSGMDPVSKNEYVDGIFCVK